VTDDNTTRISQEEIDELRERMRREIAKNAFQYDQNLAQYYTIVEMWAHIGDYAHHNFGDDLVVPSLGAVVLTAIQDMAEESGAERTIMETSVVISVAIAELVRLDHENIALKNALAATENGG
jgi:hypothetical protein